MTYTTVSMQIRSSRENNGKWTMKIILETTKNMCKVIIPFSTCVSQNAQEKQDTSYQRVRWWPKSE